MAKGWPGEPDMDYDVLVAESKAAENVGKPIENVIFDFGNVLVYWEPSKALVGRYSPESIDWFLDDANSGLYTAFDMTDMGVTEAESVEWARANRGERAATMLDYYYANFVDTLGGAVPGMRPLIEDLKAAGLGAWGLSNWSTGTYPIAEENNAVLQALDDKVVSGYVKLRKPNADIFEYAFKQFGIDAASSLFVDDKAMNIVGANAVGMRGVRFSDPYKLRQLLIDNGVNIPAVQ